jgi:patatin-like phospholipase/acyl hydrolase
MNDVFYYIEPGISNFQSCNQLQFVITNAVKINAVVLHSIAKKELMDLLIECIQLQMEELMDLLMESTLNQGVQHLAFGIYLPFWDFPHKRIYVTDAICEGSGKCEKPNVKIIGALNM